MRVELLRCPKCESFVEPFDIDYAYLEGLNDVVDLEEHDFMCECTHCSQKFIFNVYVNYSATCERIDDKRVEDIECGDY